MAWAMGHPCVTREKGVSRATPRDNGGAKCGSRSAEDSCESFTVLAHRGQLAQDTEVARRLCFSSSDRVDLVTSPFKKEGVIFYILTSSDIKVRVGGSTLRVSIG